MDIVFVMLVGLALGSFANVLIDRLPRGESVYFVRSHCDHCHRTLTWYELFPVVSYLIQNGRCRGCSKRISLQYPLVETAFALLLVFLYIRSAGTLFDFTVYTLTALPLFVLFFSDYKYSLIPDSMIVVGVIGAMLIRISSTGLTDVTGFLPPLGAGVGASLFLLLLYLVTRGRGMGLGDVKLAFLLGFISGFPGVVVTLALAFLTGACTGVILILTGKKTLKSHVPFGPFLIAGLAVYLEWGVTIVAWWKGFI